MNLQICKERQRGGMGDFQIWDNTSKGIKIGLINLGHQTMEHDITHIAQIVLDKKITKEQREELYNKLREVFPLLNHEVKQVYN